VPKDVPDVQTKIVSADEPWADGPQMLAKADGVVLYLGAGAKWIEQTPERLAAFEQLASRGVGIVGLHWSLGSKEIDYKEHFLPLLGGFHGGKDRRFLVLETDVRVADRTHPIARGINDFRVHEEFYFKLKFADVGQVRPILKADIEDQRETVAWAFERPDGGRSFGYSGADEHKNWEREDYRRLAAQAVLWTLKLPVPEQGLPVRVSPETLKIPENE
jgi:type 1 glutamine amidotransferase